MYDNGHDDDAADASTPIVDTGPLASSTPSDVSPTEPASTTGTSLGATETTPTEVTEPPLSETAPTASDAVATSSAETTASPSSANTSEFPASSAPGTFDISSAETPSPDASTSLDLGSTAPLASTGATGFDEDSTAQAISSNAYETVPNPNAIDWLHPPGGRAPFALPTEYAALDWFDLDERPVLDSHYDETTCSTVYGDTEGELGFVECDGDNEHWACRCYSEPDTYDWAYIPKYFVDTSVNNGQACRLAAAVCLTEDLPAANPQCYDSGYWEGFSAESCLRDDRCDYHHVTPHGHVVSSVMMPFVECSSYEDSYPPGEPGYQCLGPGFKFTGLLYAVPDRTVRDTCDTGAQVYFNGIDEGSAGPLSCEPRTPTVEVIDGEERSCNARYQCSRSATTLGEQISLIYEHDTVSCYRSANSWRCRCDDQPESYSWSGVDAATACNNVLTECMSHPVE